MLFSRVYECAYSWLRVFVLNIQMKKLLSDPEAMAAAMAAAAASAPAAGGGAAEEKKEEAKKVRGSDAS